jgi:hypothetical protein
VRSPNQPANTFAFALVSSQAIAIHATDDAYRAAVDMA